MQPVRPTGRASRAGGPQTRMAVSPALPDPRSPRPRRIPARHTSSRHPLALADRQRHVDTAESERAMSRPFPDLARKLAAQLVALFAQDAALARRLNAAHKRLQSANNRRWWGLHPDGLAVVYGEDPAAVDVAFAEPAPRCSARPTRSQQSITSTGASPAPSSPTRPPPRNADSSPPRSASSSDSSWMRWWPPAGQRRKHAQRP